jgi:hypothetical protein
MDNAERAAELVYRYVKARARVMGVIPDRTDWTGLEPEIRKGSRLFADFIYIDLEDPRVITADEHQHAHKFYEAIIEGCDIDMDADLLARWRNYVLRDGPVPPYPEC